MIYQVITGRLPFVGSLQDVIEQKRSGKPVAPSLLASGVPRDLEELCMRLLSAEPSLRPTSEDLAQGSR